MSSQKNAKAATSSSAQPIERQIAIKQLKLSADRAALEILFQRYSDELEEISRLKRSIARSKIVH
ncbi:hypothetical protein [Pseudomonas oryzihabitans]|uniref:hypothetical protein n=1 Tax=Pseudomonas oryzihabitans TaxID=47885 RepID=UPI0028957C94|nr:hypothetical protein [Pseudomonas oryzihabitans]MDT3721003.1 hypothetical protein [Pseudomonas oryzihabitans]